MIRFDEDITGTAVGDNRFDIDISDDDAEKLVSVKDAIEYINSH